MGKSKNRLMGRAKNLSYKFDMTRHQAIDFVVNELVARPTSIKAKNMISLFGLQSEELTEAGMQFEQAVSLDKTIILK